MNMQKEDMTVRIHLSFLGSPSTKYTDNYVLISLYYNLNPLYYPYTMIIKTRLVSINY